MVAAIDATGSGLLTAPSMKWVTRGFLPTFASPVMDDERLYTVDNSAILGAFDLEDRQAGLAEDARHAAEGLARARRRQAVRRHRERQVLHPAADRHRRRGRSTRTSSARRPIPSRSSRRPPSPTDASTSSSMGRRPTRTRPDTSTPSVDRGRRVRPRPRPTGRRLDGGAGTEPVAQVQVFPYEALLDPGQKQAFTLKLYDAKGNFIRNEPASRRRSGRSMLLQGTVGPDGDLRRAGVGRFGRIRQGDRSASVDGAGARPRDSAAAVDLRLQRPTRRRCRGGRRTARRRSGRATTPASSSGRATTPSAVARP